MDAARIQIAVARLDLWLLRNAFWLRLGAMAMAALAAALLLAVIHTDK